MAINDLTVKGDKENDPIEKIGYLCLANEKENTENPITLHQAEIDLIEIRSIIERQNILNTVTNRAKVEFKANLIIDQNIKEVHIDVFPDLNKILI